MQIDPAKDGLSLLNRTRLVSGAAFNPKNSFFGNVGNFTPPEKTPDQVYGGTYAQVLSGSRLATNVIAQNPMNNNPTIAGLKYFGQSPAFKVALDMPFAKPVGVFKALESGAGSCGFSILTNPLLQGDIPLASAMGILITGSELLSDSPILGAVSGIVNNIGNALPSSIFTVTDAIGSFTNQVTDIIGGQASSLIRLTDSNVLIPFMGAAATAFAGSGATPFGLEKLSIGISLAFEVKKALKL